MTAPLRIGDPVQVHAETEVLTLISVDGADAWCRDGAGGHVQYRLEDLERARSRAYLDANETRRRMDEIEPNRVQMQRDYDRFIAGDTAP